MDTFIVEQSQKNSQHAGPFCNHDLPERSLVSAWAAWSQYQTQPGYSARKHGG